jgi:hypothetical protein
MIAPAPLPVFPCDWQTKKPLTDRASERDGVLT